MHYVCSKFLLEFFHLDSGRRMPRMPHIMYCSFYWKILVRIKVLTIAWTTPMKLESWRKVVKSSFTRSSFTLPKWRVEKVNMKWDGKNRDDPKVVGSTIIWVGFVVFTIIWLTFGRGTVAVLTVKGWQFPWCTVEILGFIVFTWYNFGRGVGKLISPHPQR